MLLSPSGLGLGPTKLISPTSTLISCGNSSVLSLSHEFPHFSYSRIVNRIISRAIGIPYVGSIHFHGSEFEHLEFLFIFAYSWGVIKIGPPSSSLMAIPTGTNTISTRGNNISENDISNALLVKLRYIF